MYKLSTASGTVSDTLDRKILPLYYFTKVANVGDQMNPWLIRRMFKCEVVKVLPNQKPHLVAIGSLMKLANEHSHVWGTGVMRPTDPIAALRPGNIHAVRGKLSLRCLRECGISVGDIPLGDPAFLAGAEYLTESTLSKKFRVGIAAHYADRDAPWVQSALRSSDCADLDVRLPVPEFLQRMSECETVISSSLHGLIIAEGLAIPNVWIELSNKVVGDGFKFRDWFSLAEDPQERPARPDQGPEALSRRTQLHGMQIDRAALLSAFPRTLLDS